MTQAACDYRAPAWLFNDANDWPVIEARVALRAQYEELHAQELIRGDDLGWIMCVCGRRLTLPHVYKCFYCGLWLCRQCAGGHFG